MRQLLSAIVVTIAGASTASGQAHKPRVAGIAPPPPVTQPNYPPPGYPRYGAPVVYGSVPVLVSADGRIFANFGYGFEPVVRACGRYYGVSYAPQAYRPFETQPAPSPAYQRPTYTPPTYKPSTFGPQNTQPAPAQPTASERMLPQGYAPPSLGVQQPVAAGPCYATDARGQIIVIR